MRILSNIISAIGGIALAIATVVIVVGVFVIAVHLAR